MPIAATDWVGTTLSVRVIDVGEYEGLPFAVLEFLPGGSLEDRCRDAQGKPCSCGSFIRYSSRLAGAFSDLFFELPKVMESSSIRAYKTQGTFEYVLAKSGFARVDFSDQLQTTPLLASFFAQAPEWDAIESALLMLVKVFALESSGFISAGVDRNDAVRCLRAHGLTEKGRTGLFQAIADGANTVREEIAADRLKYF